MLRRRSRHLLLVVVALLAVGLGLVAALDGTPSWPAQQGDQISTLHASDQATVVALERRIIRVHVTSPVDVPLGLGSGELAAVAALLALATGLVLAPSRLGPDRWRRHLAWVLRSPPADERALIPVH